MFARAGQLALPGQAAQLGLDGVAYAPPDSDRSPERASLSLGTHTGFCIPAELLDDSPNSPGPAPAQIALDLDAWEAAPQLSLWGRLAMQREVLAFGEWDRYAKCGWVRFKTDGDVDARRRESGSWSPGGVVRCGYPGCPWCGSQLAQTRAAELGACMKAHRGRADVDADCWMLTPTIPHYATDSASLVVEQLYAAQAMLVRSKEWRTFGKQWGLEGNGVRCLDAVAGGANGLHAHFHTALFPTRAGLPTSEAWRLGLDEKAQANEWLIPRDGIERYWAATIADNVQALPVDLATQLRAFGVWRKLSTCSQRVRERYLTDVAAPLVVAWERCCRAVGVVIENVEQFRRTALKLTPSEDGASYFTSWMLADEVTRSTVKDRSPLRLLDAITAGIRGAAFTYKQFRRAVDGRQWVTGIADLRKRLGVSDEDVQAYADERRRLREAVLESEGTPVVKKRELNLKIRAHLFPVVHALGWEQVFSFIDAADAALHPSMLPNNVTADLQRQLDAFLWENLALVAESRRGSSPSDDPLTS